VKINIVTSNQSRRLITQVLILPKLFPAKYLQNETVSCILQIAYTSLAAIMILLHIYVLQIVFDELG
jgi:hypothetical protein